MSLRPKIFKGNQQAFRIIAKNKNIQALMTKPFIPSFSNSLLSRRNNILLHSNNLCLFA
jgi:hypothetical protein